MQQYDRVYAYLVGKKQYSFIKLKRTDSIFSENLNELLNYNVICVAYKGDQAFFTSINDAQPQKYRVKLEPIKAGTLRRQINHLSNQQANQDMREELAFEAFKIQDQIRQEKNREIAAFRKKFYPIIFLCNDKLVEMSGSIQNAAQQGGIAEEISL